MVEPGGIEPLSQDFEALQLDVSECIIDEA